MDSAYLHSPIPPLPLPQNTNNQKGPEITREGTEVGVVPCPRL